MKRILIFAYGLACYAVFLATFLYAIGFLGNFLVPRTIDGEPGIAFGAALAIDLALLALFAIQHSVMARPAFKRRWTRVVAPAAERSTYVLFSSVALLVLFAFWQPIGGTIWQVDSRAAEAALYALYGFGWVLLLIATFQIDHFDLFGLRQTWLEMRGKHSQSPAFRTPILYRHVRHPIYVGWLLIFWSAPTMTVAHFVFALATTAYILIAIRFEEHDLVAAHPEYEAYRRAVPMLIPFVGKRAAPRRPLPS